MERRDARVCLGAPVLAGLVLVAAAAAANDAADIPSSTELGSAAAGPSGELTPETLADALEPDVATVPPSAAEPGVSTDEPKASTELDRDALLRLAREDQPALGPLSIGTPDAGLLVNPTPMPEGPLWTVRDPLEAYGTAETIDYIARAIQTVEARHPGSPRLVIGDISRPDGGRLNRHRSHQAGRDVDLGFYYRDGHNDDFVVARESDLDLPRTWALVRALITETDVERIFVDRSLMRVLYAHALEAEREDPDWLDEVFGRLGERGVLQHEKGHKNHLHVRFYNPLAQERGRIVYPELVAAGTVPPPMIKHRVRRGETLGALARCYGTTVSRIRAANGLRGSVLRAGRGYLIPLRRTPPETGPIEVPPRRLPRLATQALDVRDLVSAPGTGAAAR